ncbi:MAG: HD domain-containing protein [Gemmatimonadales bacterium]|nr:HD domain-containing protein [Gemmatimonadales bacterium]
MTQASSVSIASYRDTPEGKAENLNLDRMQAVQAFNARLVFMNVDESSYEEIVKGVRRVIGCDCCALFLHDATRGELVLKGSVGYDGLPEGLSISCQTLDSLHAQAFREEYLIHLDDLSQSTHITTLSGDLGSNLVLPVISQKGPFGVLDLGNLEPSSFTDSEIGMCNMLVDQMSYSLENMRLVLELRNSRDAVIRGMALLSEIRDSHIEGHLNRICAMSSYLAEQMAETGGYPEVTPDFIDTISRSASLHDVGKVGIPDSILLKPGKLTPAEYEIMKSHAAIGGKILSGLIDEFGAYDMITMGAAVAEYHHEWWDGTGYPRGLKGIQIPLSARILAICDVYDALASLRVYKEAWDYDRVKKTIQDLAGTQFDPDLVEIFLQNPKELEAIRAKYSD